MLADTANYNSIAPRLLSFVVRCRTCASGACTSGKVRPHSVAHRRLQRWRASSEGGRCCVTGKKKPGARARDEEVVKRGDEIATAKSPAISDGEIVAVCVVAAADQRALTSPRATAAPLPRCARKRGNRREETGTRRRASQCGHCRIANQLVIAICARSVRVPPLALLKRRYSLRSSSG